MLPSSTYANGHEVYLQKKTELSEELVASQERQARDGISPSPECPGHGGGHRRSGRAVKVSPARGSGGCCRRRRWGSDPYHWLPEAATGPWRGVCAPPQGLPGLGLFPGLLPYISKFYHSYLSLLPSIHWYLCCYVYVLSIQPTKMQSYRRYFQLNFYL
jgi:hypothetical protein